MGPNHWSKLPSGHPSLAAARPTGPQWHGSSCSSSARSSWHGASRRQKSSCNVRRCWGESGEGWNSGGRFWKVKSDSINFGTCLMFFFLFFGVRGQPGKWTGGFHPKWRCLEDYFRFSTLWVLLSMVIFWDGGVKSNSIIFETFLMFICCCVIRFSCGFLPYRHATTSRRSGMPLGGSFKYHLQKRWINTCSFDFVVFFLWGMV